MDAGRMETPFDYFFDDHTNPRTIEALKDGPLASPLEAYAQRLHEDGYAAHSGFVQLRLLGCFNRWLDRRGLASRDVGPATIEQYLRGRAQSGKLRKGDSAALFRLLPRRHVAGPPSRRRNSLLLGHPPTSPIRSPESWLRPGS